MKNLALIAFLSIGVAAGAARAQGYPDAYALRPLQLPSGMVQLKVPLVINLSKDNVGKPVFIPFDIRLGLSPELELRLFHPVHGLCVSGSAKGCDRVYNDLGVGMLFSLLREQGVELSLLGAFEVTSFASPAHMRLDVGMDFKMVRAPWSLFAGPYVGVGLNHRDTNPDWLNVPVEFAFQLERPTALFIETGFYGDLHGFADTWFSPVGVGLNYLVQHDVDIGAEFKLDHLIGNGGTADARSFIFYVALRN